MNHAELTHQRLRELLEYNPETGVFTWKVDRGNQFTRPGMVAGSVFKEGYIRVFVDGKNHMAHRLAWLHVHGEWPAGEIDHINGVKDCNSIANLRDVTHSVNQQNRRKCTKHNKCGLLGVFRSYAGWRSVIQVGGRTVHLGLFDTKEQAHASYLEAKRDKHVGCSI